MADVIAVEDEPELAQLIEMILRRAGHTVRIAADGAHALDAIQRAAPDLVLLDLGLPDVHGLDLCRKIRGDPAHARLPIGVVSGQVTPPFAAELAAGATAVLAKPFNRARLVAFVDELLSTAAASTPAPARQCPGAP